MTNLEEIRSRAELVRGVPRLEAVMGITCSQILLDGQEEKSIKDIRYQAEQCGWAVPTNDLDREASLLSRTVQ